MDEDNMFITKSYVQTLPIHNWEVYVNQNTTCSSFKSMFPLGIERIWSHTFFIPFHLVLYLIQSFKPLTSRSFLLLEESSCILSPTPSLMVDTNHREQEQNKNLKFKIPTMEKRIYIYI
jgi:hypothetical protein